MRIAALKFAPALLIFFVGGCASTATGPGAAGLVRFEQVSLRNPQTGQIYTCRMRISAATPQVARTVLEANHKACLRNARASGFTSPFQVTQWP